MSSFAKNMLPAEHKLLPSHESLLQDTNANTSDYLNIYRPVSELTRNSNLAFSERISADARNALLNSKFQSEMDSGDVFDAPPDHSIRLSDGMTSNLHGYPMGFNSESFNGVQFSGNWKPPSTELNQLHSMNQISASSRVLGLSSGLFENRLGSNPNFYCTKSSSSTNKKSGSENQSDIEGIFPEEGNGPVWCAAPWSEHLDLVHDQNASEWCKELRDPGSGIDSLFVNSDCDRSWRYRTASDSGRVSPHKRTSVNNRSGPTTHRRRGRALSGGSSASNSEFNSINLPSGQVLNAEDFDAAESGLLDPALRYTEASSVSTFEGVVDGKMHQSLAPSLRPGGDDSTLSTGSSADLHQSRMRAVGQPFSVDEKARLLVQNSSRPWSSSAPLDAPDFGSIVNANNQFPDENPLSTTKAYRPPTSDQFTQYNTGFRHNLGFPKNDQTGFAFDNLDNPPPDDSQASIDDEQLWYYEDPQGRIQGEFGTEQMCGWLLAGRYFTPSLRIRRKCDDTLSTLVDYIKLFGRIPFTPGPRIPPIQGPITPATILLVRSSLAMQQQQVALAEAALHGNMRTTPRLPLASTIGSFTANCSGDAFTKADGGGGLPMNFKNGLLPPKSNVPLSSEFDLDGKQRLQQQSLVLNQLLEAFKHGMSVNDPVYLAASSILSEMLAKGKLCPPDSSSAESMHMPTSTSAGFGWQLPSVTNQQPVSDFMELGLVGTDNQLSRSGGSGPSSLPMDPAIIQPSNLSAVGTGTTTCVDSPSRSSRHKLKATTNQNDVSSSSTPTNSSEGKFKSSKKSSPRKNAEQQHQQQHINGGTTRNEKEVEDTPRSISQSGSVSSQSSVSASVWARLTDSPPCNATDSRRHLVNDSGCISSSPTENATVGMTTTTKSCWGDGNSDKLKGKTGSQQGKTKLSNSGSNNLMISSTICEKSPGKLSSQSSSECGSQKKGKCKQQTEANGTYEKTPKKGAANKKGSNISSKSSGGNNGKVSNSDELTNLIEWVQSALTGFELLEKLDIPTFVELLTTIDAPYEVETMLLTYIGNSSRSSQFVKEFLDRRHTCWQQHRKRLEGMHESSNSSAPSKKSTSSSTVSAVDHETISNNTSSISANGVFVKAYSEPNDAQADSQWQQKKPKNSSNRKGKKTKQRS